MSYTDSSSWFAEFRPRPPRPSLRLLCFAQAGAGASKFFRWARIAPADIDLRPIRLPGRESRIAEPVLTDGHVAIQHLIDATVRIVGDAPISVYGYCSGAQLAYRFTAALSSSAGVNAQSLVVHDHPAPMIHHDRDAVHELPRDELFRRIQPLANLDLAGIDQEIAKDMIERTLRADLTLTQVGWDDFPVLDTAITAVVSPDADIDHRSIDAWRDVTSSAFRVVSGRPLEDDASIGAVIEAVYRRRET